jgi:hypothetical protein
MQQISRSRAKRIINRTDSVQGTETDGNNPSTANLTDGMMDVTA